MISHVFLLITLQGVQNILEHYNPNQFYDFTLTSDHIFRLHKNTEVKEVSVACTHFCLCSRFVLFCLGKWTGPEISHQMKVERKISDGRSGMVDRQIRHYTSFDNQSVSSWGLRTKAISVPVFEK